MTTYTLPSDVVISIEDKGDSNFVIRHEICGWPLLTTQYVHLDTLVRVAREHDCPGSGV